MKYALALTCLFAAIAFVPNPVHRSGNTQAVNSILGDVSYMNTFGHAPDAFTDEDLRIATHLAYVESLLRERNTEGLSSGLRARRETMLDLLHDYRTAGVFPRNRDHVSERRPCFIDRDGRICAVGYLIEQSAGRDAAEAINRKYQYAFIPEMTSPDVEDWIAGSGLTKEECGMIQPSYGWYEPPADSIPVSYGIGSAVLGGVNVSLNALNSVQLLNGSSNRIVPAAGFVAGAGQTILGIVNVSEGREDENGAWVRASEEKNMLSYLNIGMGTATMLLSVWNFFDGNPEIPDPTPINWNLHTVPTPDDGPGIGLTVRGRF